MKKLWDILLIVGVALVMGALMAAVFYVSAPSGNMPVTQRIAK